MSHRDLFSTYGIDSKGVVVTMNNTPCRIAGIGIVRIKMFDRIVRILDAMRHVQDLKKNLIFWRTFDLKEYKYVNEDRILEVRLGTYVMMKG